MPRNTPLFPDIVVHYVCLEGKVFHEMYQHFQAKQHALVNHNSTLSAVILLIASKADFFW